VSARRGPGHARAYLPRAHPAAGSGASSIDGHRREDSL